MYFRPCPTCGDNPDPGEKCDRCREKENGLAAVGATIKPKTNMTISILPQIEIKGKRKNYA